MHTLPTGNRRVLAPQAYFCQEQSYARQNRREETSPKCCMAASTNPLVRLPVQNAEVCTSTFQSGAAAKREAGTTPDFHQNAIFTERKVEVFRANRCRPKGVKGPSVPCGVSLVTFPLCPKNASACAMGFWLTERIQRAQRVGHSLVKERYPSETGQGSSFAGSIVSVSDMRDLCLFG